MDDRQRDAAVPARRGGDRQLSRTGLVDAHAHLQHGRFDGQRDAVIERAVAAGIDRILVPGWDVASSEAAINMAAAHPELIDAAVGVHPHNAADLDEPAWQRLEELAAAPGVRAVGEIGLDYFRNLSPPEVQRDALARQLALAAERGLPVVVHDREAHADVTRTLLEWSAAGPERRGMLHAFSGDVAMALDLVAAGFTISFALPLTFGSAKGPRAAATALPAGWFLVETDAPYLGPDRAVNNEPPTVLRVASELGRLRGEEPTQIADQVRAAYRSLFGT